MEISSHLTQVIILVFTAVLVCYFNLNRERKEYFSKAQAYNRRAKLTGLYY